MFWLWSYCAGIRDIVFQSNNKTGERYGTGVFFLVHYGTGGSRGRGCFIGVGVDNLEKISFQNLCNHPCAFGCALRYCSILLIDNRLERAALGVSFLMG